MTLKQLITLILILGCHFAARGQSQLSAPDWAPDSKRFVYVGAEEKNADLYLFDLSTKESTRITFTDSMEWTPSWSPDGKSIAFISNRNGGRQIYVYDLKSKQTNQLTQSSLAAGAPSWSPDSKTVYFTLSDFKAGVFDVYSKKLGGTLDRLDLDTGRNYIYPSVSPDGSILLFGSKGKEPGETYHIGIKALAGNKETQLENMPLVSYNPSWSPDGKSVVFINQSERRNTSAAIYQTDLSGQEPNLLVKCEKGCFQARISPDGNFLLYKEGWGEENTGIQLLNLKTKEQDLILRTKD